MERYVITDGSSRYTRISKFEARKLFEKGESFYIIAHKMRPGFPFSMGMTVDSARHNGESAASVAYGNKDITGFDSMVANFCYYNANCHETGTYPAFYLVTKKKTKAEGKA